jgi:hypothetical protein
VTNGTFKFTRRVKPGDPNEYNAPFREASAEISWSTDEGETTEDAAEIIANVSEAVVAKVNEMLGAKKSVQTVQSAEADAREQGSDMESRVAVATEPEKPRRGRPPKSKEPQVDVEPAAVEAKEDDLLGDLTTPAVQMLTMKDFMDAITRKNSERMARPEEEGPERRSPQNIRDLIGKYVQIPKTARDIPPELRYQFLDELEKL